MDVYKWPREDGIKDHDIYDDKWFGTEAPCIL